MQKNDSNGGAKRRPILSRAKGSGGLARGIETAIIEGVDEPHYPYCALPPHFFERSLAAETPRGASISLESWRFSVKTR